MTDQPKVIISKTAKVDASAVLEYPVRIYGNVIVRKDCSIGKFSFINSYSAIHEGSQIGRYCSIGRNVDIGAWEHPLDRLSTSPVSYNIAQHFPDHAAVLPQVMLKRAETTVIGHDVWIGTGAIIRRGVTVGDGAVIGARSFVTRDVGPYEIVGGTPAQLIRKRFDPQIVRALLELKWWDLDEADLASVPFATIELAVARLREIRGAVARKGDASDASLKLVRNAPRADTSALQALIDAIPANPRRPPNPEEMAFATFLRDKLIDANAPTPLVDAVLDEASRITTRYRADDPVDIIILNSKLAHLIEIVSQRPDSEAALEPEHLRTVREVLRTK